MKPTTQSFYAGAIQRVIEHVVSHLGEALAFDAGAAGRIVLRRCRDCAPDQLRSDAGVLVAPDVALPEGLGEEHIAAGDYASTTHIGPYEQLGDIWARFMGEWLPASGRRLGDGASYEVYHNTPMDTPTEQLLTELRVPLA